jgi:hypothetical protein
MFGFECLYNIGDFFGTRGCIYEQKDHQRKVDLEF